MIKTCNRHVGLGTRRRSRPRCGFTFTELLIASTIMTLVAGAMGSLVLAVHNANDYCHGQSVAAQHARVAIERIERAVRGATASEQFPGCLVLFDEVGAWDFPDTLVVWSPTTVAVDPAGLPRVRELLIFCPDPAQPSRLLEIRLPSNSTVPAVTNLAGWQALVDGIKANAASERVELSNRLRTAAVTEGSNDPADLRACIRFRTILAPDATEWAAYRAGTKQWTDLSWPLGLRGSTTGIRRVVCQCEIQTLSDGSATAAQTAVPFFGSATLTCELKR